ncbi:hypothetical protein Hamer_G025104 [Homarus americanus]|uniref:Secreted protein n=1 Tax=Homarus americanus TaxID=6706 RepID=A0A8J5ND92_HOMAM|nr:hypothetical protein Hamer_G025104 [Homarus americanus]
MWKLVLVVMAMLHGAGSSDERATTNSRRKTQPDRGPERLLQLTVRSTVEAASLTTNFSCLGTFGLESREDHHGLYRLSRYKPPVVDVFRATKEMQEAAYLKGAGRLRVQQYNILPVHERYSLLAAAASPPNATFT